MSDAARYLRRVGPGLLLEHERRLRANAEQEPIASWQEAKRILSKQESYCDVEGKWRRRRIDC
jgi:hypothetical protein